MRPRTAALLLAAVVVFVSVSIGNTHSGDTTYVSPGTTAQGVLPVALRNPAPNYPVEIEVDEGSEAAASSTAANGSQSSMVDVATSTDAASPTATTIQSGPAVVPLPSTSTTIASPPTTTSFSTTTTIPSDSVVVTVPPATSPGGRYWEWGWGLYNDQVSAEVHALFDWSTINFGNVPHNQETLERLNRILAINPDHKFVLELWPTMNLGDSMDENNLQATLFHYLYKPGVREAVLQAIRDQIGFVLEGIDKPENVVGLTFLEELPMHFTTHRETLGWQRGQDMPWDVARFESQINADLGEPFDMANEAHRLWWGRKYTETLAEIHAVTKEASGGREVFIWQATAFRTLDMLQPGESMTQGDVIPIHYRDLVKRGLVDGIFCYPNNDAIWQERAMAIVEDLDIPFWSQLSTPGSMRASRWDETLRLARDARPGNLGTLFFLASSTGEGTWNPMPYEDGVRLWTVEDHAKKLAQGLLDS